MRGTNTSYSTRPPPSLSQMPSYYITNINPLNQTSNFNHQFPLNHQISSQNNIGYDNNQLLIHELPQLDSPTTISTSLATNDHQGQNSINNNNNEDQFCDEWSVDDKLFAPQVMEAPSSSSYSYPNFLLDGNDQNHMSQLLHCYPDL